MDLQSISWEESVSCCYGATLPKDTTLNSPCSWATSDPSSFLIRGDNYLHDHQKVTKISCINISSKDSPIEKIVLRL